MARSSHNYTQLAIGDCGHVCQAWPLFGSYSAGKRVDMMFCETCMREAQRLPNDEMPVVLVRVVEKTAGEKTAEMPAVKPPKKKPAKKAAKKAVKVNPWMQLATLDTVLDEKSETL